MLVHGEIGSLRIVCGPPLNVLETDRIVRSDFNLAFALLRALVHIEKFELHACAGDTEQRDAPHKSCLHITKHGGISSALRGPLNNVDLALRHGDVVYLSSELRLHSDVA